MRKRIRYGEFLIELRDNEATVYDLKTEMRVFRGELEEVMEALQEKVNGVFDIKGFSLTSKKRRGFDWEF